MHETLKTLKHGGWLVDYLTGQGIDIGCGDCPITSKAHPFDTADGDANHITDYLETNTQYDYVYSSHCLEHMNDPEQTILDWWKLVRPGGALIVIVPDEDLYEQGHFPSIFNFDHKHTFTISKAQSWSPVSLNMLDLANSLPGGKLKRLVVQDACYDRSLVKWGSPEAIDQTLNDTVLAQIECVVTKRVPTSLMDFVVQLQQSERLPAEFQQVLDDNFWDLLA